MFQPNHGLLSLEETITLDIQNISRVNYKKQDADLPKTNITNHEISKSPVQVEGLANTQNTVKQSVCNEELKTERD